MILTKCEKYAKMYFCAKGMSWMKLTEQGVTSPLAKFFSEEEMNPTTTLENSPATESPKPANEQCAICFSEFTDQEVGIPENCEHNFCLSCILEWAKVRRKRRGRWKECFVVLVE